jgi:hypothetical protein
VYGLTKQAFAHDIPGQQEAAWIGNLGNADFATVKNA